MGCNMCTSNSIKFEIQQYFSSSITQLHLHNIRLSELLQSIKSHFLVIDKETYHQSQVKTEKQSVIDKQKYVSFINDKILINYSQSNESNLNNPLFFFFPKDQKAFLMNYFNRLYDNLNFGLEQLILFFMFFVNSEKFQSDKILFSQLEQTLSLLIFPNKKDCISFSSFKTMLSEVIYNIVVLPAVCLYLTSQNEVIKTEIHLILEGSYRKERINSYVVCELRVLEFYTFFSKDDLRLFLSQSEFEIQLFERMNTLFSWELDQVVSGFNSLSEK